MIFKAYVLLSSVYVSLIMILKDVFNIVVNHNYTTQLLYTWTTLTRNNIYFMRSRVKMNKPKVKKNSKHDCKTTISIFSNVLTFKSCFSLNNYQLVLKNINVFFFFTFICLKIRMYHLLFKKKWLLRSKKIDIYRTKSKNW